MNMKIYPGYNHIFEIGILGLVYSLTLRCLVNDRSEKAFSTPVMDTNSLLKDQKEKPSLLVEVNSAASIV